VLISLGYHGRIERHNFYVDIISAILIVALLAWEGFFDKPEDNIRPYESKPDKPEVIYAVPDGFHLQKDVEQRSCASRAKDVAIPLG